MKKPFNCAVCHQDYMRTQKQINQCIKRSGAWKCKACTLKLRNVSNCKPIGSTRISRKGYIVEKTEDGWIFQHRVVMERHIGRKLRDDELVHHLDENKKNNDIKNLEIGLWGEHTKEHHKGTKRTGIALENLRKSFGNRKTAVLTKKLIVSIKERHKNGESQLSISKDLSFSPMTINRAVHMKEWDYYGE